MIDPENTPASEPSSSPHPEAPAAEPNAAAKPAAAAHSSISPAGKPIASNSKPAAAKTANRPPASIPMHEAPSPASKAESTPEKNPLELEFTDTEMLANYTNISGKILPRTKTKLTARQQRHVVRAIKQARSMLLMR